VARIKDASVEAVKQAADIVVLVEARTRLRKVGGRYTGLCPFHQEKTPSFSVSPDRGTYHCFGCGVGGDAISFVEETEGVDFVGAIEWLADRFNVPLEYEDASPEADAARRRRERLYALLDQAATFYERYLWESASGEPVRAYLAGRGLNEAACREFRLGLSPGGNSLVRKARGREFSQAELAAAGLVSRRGGDYFANRLMFPLADARGRVVGFQARKLREDDPLRGKYVNSPEGELFHKSAILYGLHLGRAAIAKQDRALVVEGNTDVIALRQAGLEPVVASMGTALTEQQLKELVRLTRRLYLCFDSDAAGDEATLRGMNRAAAAGFDVSVVPLPEGQDPADDPGGFEQRLVGAISYERHHVRTIVRSAHTKDQALKQIRELVGDWNAMNFAWTEAVKDASDLLKMPPEMIARLRVADLPPDREANVQDPGYRLERDALAAVSVYPHLVKTLEALDETHFDHEAHRRLRAVLISPQGVNRDLTNLLAELHARAESEGIDQLTADQLLLRLRERKLRRELANAPEERLQDLQQALAKLRTRIREFA
jgi:DNA primase